MKTWLIFNFINIWVKIVFSEPSNIGFTVKSHECLRYCESPHRTKICIYEFFVSKVAKVGKSTYWESVINGISPGPAIEICLGDTIEVTMKNGLSSEELSFHWHGLRQKGFPHMDGVSMISQCPILPYTSFRYVIKPENIGTYFYHAHSDKIKCKNVEMENYNIAVRQQGDGLYGSLVVRGPGDDPFMERIFVVSARSSGSLLEFLDLEQPPVPRALIVNGQGLPKVDDKMHSSHWGSKL